jgi:hypothetical protein
VPTICKILPLYKVIQAHLEVARDELSAELDSCNLGAAIQAGLDVLSTYIDKALIGDYPLLGAGAYEFQTSICEVELNTDDIPN